MTLDELYEAQRSSSHSNTTDSNISSSESDDKKNITYTVVANKEHGGKTEVCTAEYIPEVKKLSKEEQKAIDYEHYLQQEANHKEVPQLRQMFKAINVRKIASGGFSPQPNNIRKKVIREKTPLATTFEGISYLQSVYEDSPKIFYGITVRIAGTIRSSRFGDYVRMTPIHAKQCTMIGVATNHSTFTKSELMQHKTVKLSIGEPYNRYGHKLVVKEITNEPKAIHILAGGEPSGTVIVPTTNLSDKDRISLNRYRKSVQANPLAYCGKTIEMVNSREEGLYTIYKI